MSIAFQSAQPDGLFVQLQGFAVGCICKREPDFYFSVSDVLVTPEKEDGYRGHSVRGL